MVAITIRPIDLEKMVELYRRCPVPLKRWARVSLLSGARWLRSSAARPARHRVAPHLCFLPRALTGTHTLLLVQVVTAALSEKSWPPAYQRSVLVYIYLYTRDECALSSRVSCVCPCHINSCNHVVLLAAPVVWGLIWSWRLERRRLIAFAGLGA